MFTKEIKMKYLYGMTARPFNLGAFPEPTKGFVTVEESRGKYHDIISYEYQLSEDDIFKYELCFIGWE